MALRFLKAYVIFLIITFAISECIGRSIKKVNSPQNKLGKNQLDRLLVLQKRETTPVNFSRLVAMRVIYGLASMMGLRDRIGGVLNGAFVPPGADDDDYGFDLDDDDDDDVDVGEFFDI